MGERFERRMMKRIEREIETVGIMIDLYCRHHHGNAGRCKNCREFYLYSRERLLKCPFGGEKSACSPCRIHCYRPEMRARIREVMKFAGPRMVYSHPILALLASPDGAAKAALGREEDNLTGMHGGADRLSEGIEGKCGKRFKSNSAQDRPAAAG